ncbi:MAG: HipA domain-containing protein [Gemmataceae bacterium]|nr:HipA domain-containing protein [Gemmataceae bacterium]
MKNCPGCLKAGHDTYCLPCRKRLFGGNLFGGKKVSHVLTFSRPVYDQARLAVSGRRLSISGIQTKMSLALRAGRLELTETGGQYILKPIPHGAFRHLGMAPVNEHLTMQIARQVFGISVAENALVEFAGGELAYLVRRFDVQEDGSRRLQEDFAQIAGRSEESHGKNYKYDFSCEEIGELIRKHVAAYPVEMERFFQLVVFNYLIGNGDAHLKNFSLIRNEEYGDYTLTPAYDLLNTRLHVPDETRTALPMFKDDFETPSYQANGFYAYDDFEEFGKRLQLHKARCARIMQVAVAKEREVFSLIDRSELSDECKQAYKDAVRDSIRALSHSHAESRRKGSGDQDIAPDIARHISNRPARPVKSPRRGK